MQGSLTVERMCQLAQVSRAGFYRSLQAFKPAEEEMEVRATIQQIALEHRGRYGGSPGSCATVACRSTASESCE